MDAPDEILPHLIGLVAEVFMTDPSPLNASSTAADVAGWDSVSQVMLTMRIEDMFNITLASELVNDVADLGELACLVAKTVAL